ncbi:DUF4114 domain-containing protein [Viridibacterium curvum]|uniref:PEP-CTERM sorting domain-containing protein n=1 Tax=Viridibacterium curvum TaxID=1101404 RepID=A0ABP9QH97_9RHOO
MNAKKIAFAALTAAAIGFSGASVAGPIPYPNAGVQNATSYSFTAATTGAVTAYFYGSTAGYTNELTLLINGVATGIQGLNNHSSAYGASLVLGYANAGDTLVFKMINVSPGGVGPWYSDTSMNSDKVNHVYATDFAGDSVIGAGTFVAFEDLAGGGDFNYNDETFVFTNVATSVPEPMSLLLASLGIMGLAATRRKK